jgi:WD40 repeat protein
MTYSRTTLAFLLASVTAFAAKAPIPISEPQRTTPVDFDREVAPFLSDNCLSCHCETTKKGGLNLETPALMLKGGENGPAIVPKKGAESLLLQAAAHLDDDLAMPPRDNKAKAKNLTPEQLGLLKLWIDQGAVASPKRERTVAWQPLPENLGAIFAVALSPDGQFAACSRANRLFIYHLPTGRLVTSELAHRDQVNALSFSPDGTRLASGGYREVKLWRRVPVESQPAQPLPAAGGKIAREDGQRSVTIEGNVAKLLATDGKLVAELRGSRLSRERVDERERELQVATGNVAFSKETATTAEKTVAAAKERVKKSGEAIAPKQQELAAKQKAVTELKAAKTAADQALAVAEIELKKADAAVQAAATKAAQLATAAADALKGTATVDSAKITTDAANALQEAAKARAERDQREAQRKQAGEKIDPAAKQLADAEEAAKKAETAKTISETELELAKAEERKTAGALAEAKAAVDTAEAARKKADEALQAARTAATAAEQPIQTAAFSPDGAIVATAGADQLVHTWSAETGVAIDVLKGHAVAITVLAFTPAGELVSTSADGVSLAWNLAPTWKLERTIGTGDLGSPLTDRVNALAFNRDGTQLATGSGEPSRGGEIKLWSVADGKLLRDFAKVHSDVVLSLEFSPDGKQLASGAADKMARVIDLVSGKVMRSLEGHTHHVLGVSWSADGRTLATAGADGMVKVWDATTGDRKKNIEGYDKEVTAVHFVGATANLLTSSGDSKVRLVGLDGKEVRAFPEVAQFMQSAAATADGKLVAAGGEDSVLRIWNATDGKPLATFPPPKAVVTKN